MTVYFSSARAMIYRIAQIVAGTNTCALDNTRAAIRYGWRSFTDRGA